MLLFIIMYSYIISIFIIYLWYNYFSLFSFTFKAPSLLKAKAVPDRVVFRKHGISLGIFSFFICFSKIFLVVNKASIIIGRTSGFLFQSFWISARSCVTSEFLFFNLAFWSSFCMTIISIFSHIFFVLLARLYLYLILFVFRFKVP